MERGKLQIALARKKAKEQDEQEDKR